MDEDDEKGKCPSILAGLQCMLEEEHASAHAGLAEDGLKSWTDAEEAEENKRDPFSFFRKGKKYGPLRRETEDDYVWCPHGYTLADIKEANQKFRAKYHGGRSEDPTIEEWYLEKGEVWARIKSIPGMQPWKPYKGGKEFIDVCVNAGWLQKK